MKGFMTKIFDKNGEIYQALKSLYGLVMLWKFRFSGEERILITRHVR